jgi:tRNA threonylcarbamoyl adenosine modification protein (Sua5/YciO/YrdC/YwlC family)
MRGWIGLCGWGCEGLPVRLLALDLDGTIIGDGVQVSPRVREALRRALDAGVRVTLASGRPFGQMRLLASDLGIHEPLICYQGAVVQDPGSAEVYFRRGVPLHLAREFVDFAHQRGWELCAFVDERLYVENVTPLVRFYAEYGPIKEELNPVGDLGAFLSRDPIKLIVVIDVEQAARVNDLLQERFAGRLRIVRSFDCFVEGTNLAASKGQALSFLAQKLGVAQAETMAIGDNDNDADMVAWAGLGVAMGNASPKVKAAAEYVAPPIEEDGAAEAIERFVLGQSMAGVSVVPASEPGSIERAVAVLRGGGVVAFPTDTVYGLGAHGLMAAAIEKLYEVKGRDRQKAIALLMARVEDVAQATVRVPEVAWRLAERFWPGPVTLVLPKADTVLDVLTAGGDSVAVRIPAHDVALKLISALGAPLAATSANLSGQPEALTAEEARGALGERVTFVLDGGRCPGGVASTVVDLTVVPPVIRRRGAVAREVESLLRGFVE